MDSPVTERMCLERHQNLTDRFDRFENKVTDELMKIRILWSGNGKVGAGQKLEMMWADYQAKKKSTQGWIDWAFRLVIVMLLGWLGLK